MNKKQEIKIGINNISEEWFKARIDRKTLKELSKRNDFAGWRHVITYIASLILYADDTNLFVSGKTVDEVMDKVNNILDKLKLYFEANYLHLNIKKSKFIHFKSPRDNSLTPNYNIKFNDKELQHETEIKFLGVKIEERLSWVPHIRFVTNKVCCSIAHLYEMRRIIPKK